MKKMVMALALLGALGQIAQAKQICVDVKDTEAVGYKTSGVSLDGSITFRLPTALADGKQLPLKANFDVARMYCEILGKTYVTHEAQGYDLGCAYYRVERCYSNWDSVSTSVVNIVPAVNGMPLVSVIPHQSEFLSSVTCR